MPVRRLHFPVGGLDRRYGYQSQPPFTTPDCLNVRSVDINEGRERGGSRPGITELIAPLEESVPWTPARHLWSVDVVPVPGQAPAEFIDDFESNRLVPIQDVWQVEGELPIGMVNSVAWVKRPTGFTREEYDDLVVTGQRTVQMTFRAHLHETPIEGEAYYQPSWIALDVFALDPLGAPAEGGWPGGPRSIRLLVYFRHVPEGAVASADGETKQLAGTFNLWLWAWGVQIAQVNGPTSGVYGAGDTLRLYMRVSPLTRRVDYSFAKVRGLDTLEVLAGEAGLSLPEPPIVNDEPTWGTLSGFTVNPVEVSPSVDPWRPLYVDKFVEEYVVSTPPAFDKPSPVLVAATEGGRVWSNRIAGSMQVAVDQAPKEVPEDDPGALNRLSDDTPISAAPFFGKLYITDPKNGTFYFDPQADALFEWKAAPAGATIEEQEQGLEQGDVPQGCHLLARYAGRMVLAGEPEYAVLMSKIGDPHNWLFNDPAAGAASAVDMTSEEYGVLFGPITALIAFSDDYLIIAERGSLTRLVGDLLLGGRPVNISHTVGIHGYRAWCVTPEAELLFLGSEGLFRLAPGGMSFPVPISRDRLPRELLSIDPLRREVVLAYDRIAVGVHIFILGLPDSGVGLTEHWWFDWKNKTFWPVEVFPTDTPYDAMWYEGDSATRAAVVLGCSDAGLRQFSNERATDAGGEFASHCDYGPVRLANVDSRRGVLNSVRLFKSDTSEVNVDVRVGDSAEAAYRADSVYRKLANGTAMRVKRGGSSAFVKLSGTGGAWQVENVEVDVAPVGPAKPL